MMIEDLETLGGLGAALVTAVLALGTAVRSVGRSARLHRDEALWRQALEISHGSVAQVLHALHRHTTTELIARRMARRATPGVRALMILASVLGVLAGVLSAELVANLNAPNADLALMMLLILFVGAWVFFYFALDEITSEADARRHIAQKVLDGDLDGNIVPPRRQLRPLKVAVLSAACVVVALATTAAVWSVFRILQVPGTAYPGIAMAAMPVYLAGMLTVGRSWKRLVAEAPRLELPITSGAGGDRSLPSDVDRHVEFKDKGPQVSKAGVWAVVVALLWAGSRQGARTRRTP